MREKSQKIKERRRRVLRIKLLLTLIVVAAAAVLYIRFAPSFKKVKPLEYYNRLLRESGSDSGLGESELAVILQDHVDSRKAFTRGDVLYISYNLVREAMTTRFYWDDESSRMLYTTADDVWRFPLNSASYETKDGEQRYDHEIFVGRDGSLFMATDFLQKYVNVEVLPFIEEEHVCINYKWGTRKTAVVGKKGSVREQASIKAPILTSTAKGDVLTVLEEGENWTKVLTDNGYIGYYRTKHLGQPEQTEYTRAFDEPVIPDLVLDETVNLVWHQIGLPESNDYLEQDTAEMTGVNVISPTWFSLSDNRGNFRSLADRSYVKRAHKAGWDVWGLVDNFSGDMSLAVLVASSSARANLISNLIEAADDLGMDGINIDFEYITPEEGYDYVQFIRELSVETRRAGLVLSVDVPVSLDFNAYFDRKELGAFADYLIIMGYDEHYAGSDAGSVASLTFEENGIINTLKEVPARKVISGVPFYTRMWYTTYNADGTANVWSEILSMNTVTRTLESYQVEPVWDEQTGQNYANWTLDDGVNCQIWIEDEMSIRKKAALIGKYELGGIAEWALGNERSSIWNVISEAIGQEIVTELPQEPESETENVTEEATETEAVTEAATEAATEAVTEARTEHAAEDVTEDVTEEATEAATQKASEKSLHFQDLLLKGKKSGQTA